MRETVETVGTWAAETFGEAGSNFRVVSRAFEEAAELLRAVASFDGTFAPVTIAEECADTAIVLMRLMHRLDRRLWPECFIAGGRNLARWDKPEGILMMRANARVTMMRMAGLLSVVPAVEPEGYSDMDRDRIEEAAQGVFAALYPICLICGVEIFAAIDDKMETNRKRAWKRDGSGHGYHVRLGDE